MPEDDITDEFDEELDEDSPLGRTVKNLRKQLKQAQKDLRDAQAGSAAAEEARREIALLRAGLDLKPSQIKALTATHEGEWTPDAVKATAEELGFISGSAVSSEEAESLNRINEATRGGGDPTAVDGISELDAIPDDLPQHEFTERVMATVAKHGGHTTWTTQ